MEPDALWKHMPLYPDPEVDEDYNLKLNNLREYSRLSARNPRQNRIYFNHQMITQVHTGIQTANRRVFLYKPPGVGKTCDAIGAAETRHEYLDQIFNTIDPILSSSKLDLSRALIITPSETVMTDNFHHDIIDTCTSRSYVTESLRTTNYETSAKKLGAETRSIQTAYELDTHTAFCNKIDAMSPEEISKTYSFRVIIIDEIHEFNTVVKKVPNQNGKIIERGKKQNYDKIMKFVNNIYGCLIIGLSATPIRDDILEFSSVMNILLEPKDRIDIDKWKELTRGDDLNQIEEALEEFLVPILRGKISRIKPSVQVSKAVVRTNQAPSDPPLLQYSDKKLWLSKLDNTNLESENTDYIDYTYLINTYIRAVSPGGTNNQPQFYQDAIFADNMIWPSLNGNPNEGSFGSQAIRTYVETSNTGAAFMFSVAFEQDFRRQIYNSRRILMFRIGQEVEKLQVRKRAILQANPNGDTRELDDQIEDKTENIKSFGQRMQANPNGEFDNENDLDLFTMLYTIRSRYSPVFADAIEQIIGIEYLNSANGKYEYYVSAQTNKFNIDHFDPNDRDNRECAYVYNYFKTGGIVPFGLLLRYFGYSELFINSDRGGRGGGEEISFLSSSGKTIEMPRGKRYALIYSAGDKGPNGKSGKKTMSSSKTRKILELFNHPDNKYGHYLKVLIGTDVTAQSINFKNVRQAHFTGRGWNEATDFQAEGRVDRPGGSHLNFNDDEPIPVIEFGDTRTNYSVVNRDGKDTQRYVKIFRHVAYYPVLNAKDPETGRVSNLSIGLKMYDAAAFKELKNSIPTSIMERVAYDYYLNMGNDQDIDAAGLAYVGPETSPEDVGKESYVTYNIFHARREAEWLKCRIRGHFKVYFQLRLTDVVSLCVGSHYSTVIKALTEMVNDNERIVDRHGMLNYLREENDIFFLQKVPRVLRQARLSGCPTILYIISYLAA